LTSLGVVLGVVTVVFLTLRVTPGDPAENILGENATPEDKAAFRAQQCLDRPLLEQYTHCFLRNIVNGSLGYSYEHRDRPRPVSALLRERFRPTLELAVAGLLVALVIALPLGMVSALRQYSVIDHAAMTAALVGIAMPHFWLGPMLIWLFSVRLGLLPNPGGDLQGLSTLILPAVVLGSALAAKLTRMVRTSVLEVLRAPYVTTARAKGLRERRVLLHHVLRNALLPVVTVMGMQFAALLAGTIITEKVFARPGLGTLLLEAISKRNYDVVQGTVVLIAVSYVVINALVDALYLWLDPRIRLYEAKA
jgi:peptide/nickel transport system permease protein